jgi:uncharacterized phage-associated protein
MSSTTPNLTFWIIRNADKANLTPLKLQKLLFYCYGVTKSLVKNSDLESVHFEAWKLGPVNVSTYHSFKKLGGKAISVDAGYFHSYDKETEKVLNTVLNIYDRLSAFELVKQTHLEQPYLDARDSNRSRIKDRDIVEHFKAKYRGPKIFLPELIFDIGSYEVDGLDVIPFKNIFEMETFLNESSKKVPSL